MQNEDFIEDLLKQAGKRKAPDPDMAREIEQATRAAWQSTVMTHRRNRARQIYSIAGIAAVLVIAVAVGFSGLIPQAPSPAFASLVNTDGIVYINNQEFLSNNEALKLSQNDILATGDNAYLSIKLDNGITLSSGENTRFKFNSKDEVFLFSGKLYFDSQGSNSELTINTLPGSIVDVGTQYEVLVKNDELRISMREGETILTLANARHSAFANDGSGDVLLVGQDNQVSRSSLSTTDKYWNWVLKASETISLEGKSVYDVLEQVARLTGRTVVYANANSKRIAKETRLSGDSIDPEFIESSLPFLLKTTSLSASLQSDRIEVDSASPSP